MVCAWWMEADFDWGPGTPSTAQNTSSSYLLDEMPDVWRALQSIATEIRDEKRTEKKRSEFHGGHSLRHYLDLYYSLFVADVIQL